MKVLLDFIPLVLFTYFMLSADVMTATRALLASTIAVSGLHLILQKGRLSKNQLLSLVLVSVFGGLTLYFHNVQFILWKGPILFWITSGAFLLSRYVDPKKIPLAERMFGEAFTLDPRQWNQLNMAWAILQASLGFILLGFAYFVYPVHPQWWAYAKFPGTLLVTLAFIAGQFYFLKPYLKQLPAPEK